MSAEPFILLFREPTSPDPYEEAFQAHGFQVRSVPVLAFRFVHQAALRECLARPEAYGGLLITSPRAVEVLAQVLPSVAQRDRWLEKTSYVVGPGTAERMRALGFHPEGEETGSAEALAPVIASQKEPILFLCGNRSRDVLPKWMTEAGIPYEALCVYETHLRELDVAQIDPPDWVVFFSPSGVEAVQDAPGINWSRVRKAAIGQTTARALEKAGWLPAAIAEEPTPESLVRAIARA